MCLISSRDSFLIRSYNLYTMLLDEPFKTRLKENPGDLPYWIISDLRLYFKRLFSNREREEDVVEKVDGGAYEFGQLLGTDQVDRIRSDIEPLISDDEHAKISEFKGHEVMRGLRIDVGEIDGLEEVLNHPELAETIQSYFGTDFELTTALAIHYQNIPEEELDKGEGLTRDWHIDTDARADEIRFLLFLTDQEEKGALEVVDTKKTAELLEKVGYDRIRENPGMIGKEDIKSYKGSRGTALLCNVGDQLHRGRGPAEGDSRIMLLLTFRPA